ncbi:MAG: hypothetical protein K2N88_06915 [Muribaculaceae bacterium]|nr:hypothetical protein [Muribaculaceae bacterium]
MAQQLFYYQIPTMEDFRRYQDIGAEIMEVFNKHKVDEQTALRILELTTAITLDRVGNQTDLNAINFVDCFAVNVRGYLLQLKSTKQ